jgi:hypothetical protein
LGGFELQAANLSTNNHISTNYDFSPGLSVLYSYSPESHRYTWVEGNTEGWEPWWWWFLLSVLYLTLLHLTRTLFTKQNIILPFSVLTAVAMRVFH